MLRTGLVVAHLTLVSIWLGSMAYSLGVVQPKVDRFFPDEQRREEFLIRLAHGNRWKVIGLLAALLATALAVIALSPHDRAAYTVALILYTIAAAIFCNVSWRHWPARLFALPTELAGFRRRLRIQATAILALVGTAFVLTLFESVQ